MGKREMHKLSAKRVEALKIAGRYADGGGLYLQVSPTGTRSWLFRFMRHGKAREMGLGPLHTVPLALARQKALACRQQLLDGVDPIEARGAAAAQERVEVARGKLFRDCAAEYMRAHRAEWTNAKHAAQWISTIETYTAKTLGALPVSGIDTPHVLRVLEPIWETKTETASRLRARIEKILDWATVGRFREGPNPARWKGHLDQMLPKISRSAKVKRHAALPFDEAGSFMSDLRAQDGVAARALEFIILTATRTGAAIGARWEEFDLTNHVWHVPAERMKVKRDHKVPLSAAATAVIERMRAVRQSDFVFPGQRGNKPLSNMACLALLDRMGRTDITVHGFRSTFTDWASERTNFPRHVVEMALAHTIGNKVEAAYRRGDLFEKRRKLMDAWAQHCAKRTDATVVRIRERVQAVA